MDIVKKAILFVRYAGMYSSTVTMTYKTRGSYKTFYGALATIVIYSFMAYYSIGLLLKMHSKQEFALRQTSYENIVGDDTNRYLD